MKQVFETITKDLNELTISQLNQVKKSVEGIIKHKTSEFSLDYYERPSCPFCYSSIIKKNGKTNNQTQRYKCLNSKCNKNFSSNTNTYISGSKKFHNYIWQMIEYTFDGISIRSISEKIGIPNTTVWIWRTKILRLLSEFIDKTNKLTNQIYSDETYLKINLKGTKKSKMPRISYKTKLNVKAHRELLCIQSVIDNSKRALFKINGTARLSRKKLDDFLLNLINENTILISDGEPSYIGFTDDNDIRHERVLNYKEKSRNGYSLALINSLHSSFKYMIARYKGVSTRRLDGYINLFILRFFLK